MKKTFVDDFQDCQCVRLPNNQTQILRPVGGLHSSLWNRFRADTEKLIAELEACQQGKPTHSCVIHRAITALRELQGKLSEQSEKITDLQSQLATSETLVATLQEQKYEWDELLSQLAAANERVNKIASHAKCLNEKNGIVSRIEKEYAFPKSEEEYMMRIPVGEAWSIVEIVRAALAQEGKNGDN